MTSDTIVRVTRVSDGSAVLHKELEGRSWIIGRDPEAAIFLDGDGVSRAHAELKRCPFGRWWIHDLSSTNGTLVNGRRVQSRILARGDQVVVGHFALSLDTPEPEAPSSEDGAHPLPNTESAVATRSTGMQVMPAGPPHAIGAEHLDAMMNLGRRLLRIEEDGARRQELCETMVVTFGAQGSLVVRMRAGGRIQLLNGPCSNGSPLPPAISEQMLHALWEQRRPIAAAAERSLDAASTLQTLPGLLGAPGVLACPIAQALDHIDILYLCMAETPASGPWCSLLSLIASSYQQAELVWQMRRQIRSSAFVEHELETARSLQHRLMPLDAKLDHLELVMGYEPCLWVGGDYVDAVALPQNEVLLVIADVCGKGLQGALVTTSLHTMVRATVEGGEGLLQLMVRMNRYLCRHLPDHSFVTLNAVVLDPRDGKLQCVNAGHLPVLVASLDGRVRALQSGRNVALGMMDGVSFELERDQLADDEILLMYTDGLVELLDAERRPLGTKRFSQGVGRAIAQGDEAPVRNLDMALRRMIDDHRRACLANDDVAYLIARRTAQLEVHASDYGPSIGANGSSSFSSGTRLCPLGNVVTSGGHM